MVGNGARRMARWSTAIVLVGAVSSGTAGNAFGYSEYGVSVPDSTFRQGTGTQEITVSVAAPAVGTGESLLVWPFYNSSDHWLVGVTADRSTGATCGYDVGQWQCTPGVSGWQAGHLHVLVNTAKAMDCGMQPGVCQTDELSVQSIPGPPDSDGPPSGQPFTVLGNVVIMPNSAPPTHGPSPTAAPSTQTYRPPLASASALRQTYGGPASSPAASLSAPTTPPAVPAATPSTQMSIDAEHTTRAATPPDGSPLGLYLALAIPVAAGVSAPLAFRTYRRRRRAGAE